MRKYVRASLISFFILEWMKASRCSSVESPRVSRQRKKQARFNAQVTEWLMVADCKSAALRSYGGSNPPLCTRIFELRVLQARERSMEDGKA